MKKLFYVALTVMLSVISCQEFDDSAIWNKLDDHESRIMNLEELCKQMNTNIASLQTLVTALQNNDYVTAVVPVTKDNETVGYTISFTKSQPITIYHGEDGKDGADGKDGENGKDGQDGQDGINGKDGKDGITPIVGVKKDIDGIYYWTLNGDWLFDASGKKIKAQGVDGKDGVYGKDGQNGKTPEFKIENGDWYVSYDEGMSWDVIGQATGADGITPQFKMENGLWHVSYDNGVTWNKLGKAEGIDGVTPEFKIENGYWHVSYDEGMSWDVLGHATGADGVTPQIKIENGYWQITYDNGKSWSKLGKAEGIDGITPMLKIEDEYWYISYDNGEYWEMLGKATGEDGKDGINGKNGENGDSFFQYVDTSNSDYVEFILTDGTHITLPTWYAFEELRTLCNKMNKNISSLQEIVTALEKNDYLTSCTPLMENGVELGYILQFEKYGPVVIYHGKDGSDGKDGIAPKISAAENWEGILCWTLNGDWMYDEYGNPIPVHGRDGVDGKDAVSPQLKIEDGYWYVSYDNGKTWSKLNKATGEDGKDAINYFQDVTQDGDYVYLTLLSGEVVEVPKHHPLSVTFDETEDIRVLANKTYSIGYKITGADDNTVIKALAQDGFRAVVKKTDNATGVIEITTPSTILPTEVLVFVTDGKERTIMRSINFVEGVIIVSSKSFSVDYAGGTVTVPLSTNIDYTVEIPESDQSWVTLVQTRAVMREETLTFTVAQNEQQEVRYTTVRLVDALGVVSETILITQKTGIAKSVHVETAGTLEDLIDGDNTNLIEELTVTGNLNALDFEYIRTKLSKLKFLDLSGLNNKTIPSSCFANSTVATILLPVELTTIPDRAFYQAKITSIYIPETVQSIGNNAFFQCKSLSGDLYVPNATTSIGDYCFQECTFDGTLNLGNGLQSIGGHAFCQSTFSGDLIIPDSVTEMGEGVFRQCGSFNGKLQMGNAISEIPAKAFFECVGLSGKLTIPSNVTLIGEGAFAYCANFTGNLVIPDKVETIEYGAFYGCEGFDGYLSLGTALKEIGELAFMKFSCIVKVGAYDDNGRADFYWCVKSIVFSKVYSKSLNPPTIYYGNSYQVVKSTSSNISYQPIEGHRLSKCSTFVSSSSYAKDTKLAYLVVPTGSKSLYKADENWANQFNRIEETDF